MKIVLAHQWPALTPFDIPIYLDGPVQGGGDWQQSFISHFVNHSAKSWSDSFRKRMLPRIVFLVSCTWGNKHSLAQYFVGKYETISPQCKDEVKKSLAEWSASSFDIAINKGIVVYGLFPEDKNNPRRDGLPYACEAMFDLGISLGCVHTDSDRHAMLVAKHPDFPGIDEIDSSFKVTVGKDWCEENTRYVQNPEELAKWILGYAESFFD